MEDKYYRYTSDVYRYKPIYGYFIIFWLCFNIFQSWYFGTTNFEVERDSMCYVQGE